jgi:hypothetical protein
MAVIRDISGFQIFSGSEVGHAHVVAHRALDLGQLDRGHALLGDWLEGRSGEGSEWVHIQWHMLVFELAVGDWKGAHARFAEHLLPAARTTDFAVTDGSSALWRLALSADRPVALPWKEVAARARVRLRAEREPYAELHDLLALAGAQDARSITDWIGDRQWNQSREDTLLGFARAFLALARGNLLRAADVLEPLLPALPMLGGSRAQNELFHDIHRFARDAAPRARVA